METWHGGTVRWIPREDGGRTVPPAGEFFGATAAVVKPGAPADAYDTRDHFSIVLRIPAESRGASDAAIDVTFLAPEVVPEAVGPGCLLAVFDGPRIIAEVMLD